MCADPIQARLRTQGESVDAGKCVEVLREEANTKGTRYCEVRLVGDARGRAEWVRPEFLEYPRSSADMEVTAEQEAPNEFTFVQTRGGATTQDDLAGFQVKQQAYICTRIMHRSCLPIGRASEQRAVCAECSQCRARAIDSDAAPNSDARGAASLGTVGRMLGNVEGLSSIFWEVMNELGTTKEEAVCDGPANTAARAGIIRKLGLRAASESEAEISETDLTGAMWAGISRMAHRAMSA